MDRSSPCRDRAGPRTTALLLLAGCWLAVGGCGGSAPAPRTQVIHGREWIDAAVTAMQSEGVVFAPYNVLPVLGAEATQQHYECIHAVNQAVLLGLTSRYAVRPARRRPSNGGLPASLRGPAGPRVAVHVQAFRCGLVVGDEAYTAVASGDPGGPQVVRGEVVLSVHDRTTGAAIIDVRAEAIGGDGLAAARAAADTAVRQLMTSGAAAAGDL